MHILWFEFGAAERHALLLATYAGLSTTIGGAIAVCRPTSPLCVPPPPLQIIKRPGDALMAFLLGLAFGVMFLLSVWELWIHAAMEYGFWSVTLPVAGGALLYVAVQPLLPTFNEEGTSTHTQARAATLCAFIHDTHDHINRRLARWTRPPTPSQEHVQPMVEVCQRMFGIRFFCARVDDNEANRQ